MTKARRVDAGEPGAWSGTAVRRGAEALGEGGILGHPTATVYGLGAGPRRLDGEIARLKGRAPGPPLLRLGPDVETLRRVHPELRWSPRARRLAGTFWPGPLTLVLPDGTGTGLGVRVEAHSLTRGVLEAYGGTMSSTSLNVSGRRPARTPLEVREALVAMPASAVPVTWLDAGPLPGSPPSTVLSLVGGEPELLREGAVAAPRIEACLEEEVARAGR